MFSSLKKFIKKSPTHAKLRTQMLETLNTKLTEHKALGAVTPMLQIDKNKNAFIVLEIDIHQKDHWDKILPTIETLLKTHYSDQLSNLTLALTAQTAPSPNAPSQTTTQPAKKTNAPIGHQRPLTHVKRIIMVASGKGGVGKSTATAHLARALSDQGLSVGIMDADIYGPSQPRMMGIEGQKPDQDPDTSKIIPIDANGIKVMSIGLMVDPEAALVWRGPIVQKALMQLMDDVRWGSADQPLDVLLIDMPPGTGDVQITLAQKMKIDSAIIISTPQDIALIDARRGIDMFKKVNIPIAGIIENMSTHICSACGHEEHIFGHGGAKEESKKLNVSFLGEIPLSANIRADSDNGNIQTIPAYEMIANMLMKSFQGS